MQYLQIFKALQSENARNYIFMWRSKQYLLTLTAVCISFQKYPLMLSVLYKKAVPYLCGQNPLKNTCDSVHFLVKLHVEDRKHY